MKRTMKIASILLIVFLVGVLSTQKIMAKEDGTKQTLWEWIVWIAQYCVGVHDQEPNAHGLYFAGDGDVGIGTTNPGAKLHVSGGDVFLQGGGYNFVPPTGGDADLAFYRGGTGFAILRRYATDYTIMQLWAPPGWAGSNEATLAIVRGDEPNVEYFDLYNNGYPSETQYGIRMQRRGTGEYRDFVFDYSDGAVKSEVMRMKPSGNVGIGTASPQYKLDVEGYVEAHGYYTGDIIFQKDGKKLWRMFEDEEGLYLENVKTKKVSRIFLEDDLASWKAELKQELREEILAELRG